MTVRVYGIKSLAAYACTYMYMYVYIHWPFQQWDAYVCINAHMHCKLVPCCHLNFFQAKEYPTLKDNDFLCTGERIVIGENRSAFIKTLSADIQVCIFMCTYMYVHIYTCLIHVTCHTLGKLTESNIFQYRRYKNFFCTELEIS